MGRAFFYERGSPVTRMEAYIEGCSSIEMPPPRHVQEIYFQWGAMTPTILHGAAQGHLAHKKQHPLLGPP